MKKLALIITAVLFVSGLSFAQMQNNQNKSASMQQSMNNQSMMQGKMMHNNNMCPMCGMMMNNNMPMMKYMMMVNKLPNMQKQLSLTDEQVNNLIDLQTGLKKQMIDSQADITKSHMKMERMLENMASADMIRKQMQQCADMKINMKMAAYETFNKMNSLLTDGQKENLKGMMMKDDDMMQKGMMQGEMMHNQDNQ